MSRQTIKFRNFITLQRGFDLPNQSRNGGQIPIIASTGVCGYHNESRVPAPGVVTGRSGSLGSVQYVGVDFWPLNTTLWVKQFNNNNPRYVYYYMQTMNLEQFNSGAGVPTLNRNDLDSVDVCIHDYPEQEKIASILSSYNNLIDNNNRRIAVLEEMVQRLYREWFMYFRFPGHENIPMVESELGMIPEGWSVGRVNDICNKIFSGGTPTTTIDTYWNGEFYWLSSGETRNKFIISTDKTITEQGVENSSTRLAEKKDVVIASAGQGKTRGQTSYLLIDTYINQSVIALRGKPYFKEFLFFNIRGRYSELRNASDSSSIRGSITTVLMSGLETIIPSDEVVKMFSIEASLFIEQIGVLERKNVTLRKTRDLLLPRLISGDIDVSKINIPVGEV